MGSMNLIGPHRLTYDAVTANVGGESPGVFALGYNGKGGQTCGAAFVTRQPHTRPYFNPAKNSTKSLSSIRLKCLSTSSGMP